MLEGCLTGLCNHKEGHLQRSDLPQTSMSRPAVVIASLLEGARFAHRSSGAHHSVRHCVIEKADPTSDSHNANGEASNQRACSAPAHPPLRLLVWAQGMGNAVQMYWDLHEVDNIGVVPQALWKKEVFAQWLLGRHAYSLGLRLARDQRSYTQPPGKGW